MLQTLKIFALYVFAVTGMLGFMGSAEAQTRVSAGFEYGIIGESINNAHQPERGVILSTLGISQVVISQLSNNGQFGGTQGNDYEVDVSILFNNGTTTTFAAAVNWRDTSGPTNRGIGLIRPLGSAADGSGYTPQSGITRLTCCDLLTKPSLTAKQPQVKKFLRLAEMLRPVVCWMH